MKRTWLVGLALLVAAIPAAAVAQAAVKASDSVLVAVDRDQEVAAGEEVGTLVVVSGNATIAGLVRTVVVVDGTLTVTGTVEEDVVAVETNVTLGSTAAVGGDVLLARGELIQESGATIEGSVTRNFDFRFGWVLTLLSVLFWIGITISLVIAGLVLVAIARRQVRGTGDLLTADVGPAVLATVILVIALPAIAIAAMVTLFGLPFGLALLLLVLPMLWVAGYIVVSERLGRAILSSTVASGAQPSPYLAVAVGLLLFQMIGLIPGLGGLVIVIAATYGAGGLALYAWRTWRSSTREPVVAS